MTVIRSPANEGGGGGASLSPWFSNVAQFIQGKLGSLTAIPLASECSSLNLELESISVVGTATVGVVKTKSGGVIFSKTGGNANSYRIVRSKKGAQAADGEPQVKSLRTAKWAVATRTLIVQTQATFEIPLCNLTDELTSDSFLGLSSATSGTNWVIRIGAGTGIDTGVAFDAAHWYTPVLIADASLVTAYLLDGDGKYIATLGTAAQSDAPNSPGCWDFYPQNKATAANVEAHVDCVMVLTEREP